MDTPELTTLRAREFTEKFPSIEGDPNHEQLGQAGLVAAAATSVSTIEHRGSLSAVLFPCFLILLSHL